MGKGADYSGFVQITTFPNKLLNIISRVISCRWVFISLLRHLLDVVVLLLLERAFVSRTPRCGQNGIIGGEMGPADW